MAYRHVMREASGLFDDGATYSSRDVLGSLKGRRAALRLVPAPSALCVPPLNPREAATPYWTRVEVALAEAAPVGLTLEEREGLFAARVRSAWLDEASALADFEVRFHLAGPGAPGPLGSPEVRARLLREPRLRVRVVGEAKAEVEVTSSAAPSRVLAGGPLLLVEWPDISEGDDLERLVNLAIFLSRELDRA